MLNKKLLKIIEILVINFLIPELLNPLRVTYSFTKSLISDGNEYTRGEYSDEDKKCNDLGGVCEDITINKCSTNWKKNLCRGDEYYQCCLGEIKKKTLLEQLYNPSDMIFTILLIIFALVYILLTYGVLVNENIFSNKFLSKKILKLSKYFLKFYKSIAYSNIFIIIINFLEKKYVDYLKKNNKYYFGNFKKNVEFELELFKYFLFIFNVFIQLKKNK